MFPSAHTKLEHSFYDFLSGGFLGAVLSTITYPINVVKNNIQSEMGGKQLSAYQTLRAVYNSRGQSVIEFYKGAKWNFVRSLLSWGIINASYEFYLSSVKELMVIEV